MTLKLQNYIEQRPTWPQAGKHVLAQYDETSVVVYQAYRPAIADHAVAHQAFGGPFSFERMTWIKPNFLWMMYRSGWALKEHQTRVLALHVRRPVFDHWLETAVASSAKASHLQADDWKRAVKSSSARFQWDPDHAPSGQGVTRRAIQVGLRGREIDGFRGDAFVRIEDVTPLVHEQREHRVTLDELRTPAERVYPLSAAARANLRADVLTE
ncbi:MAG: DUF4291 domain-containing protein [Myxococcota bacterium]